MVSKLLSFYTDLGDDLYIVHNDDGSYAVGATGDIIIATCISFEDAYNVFRTNMERMCKHVVDRETGK